MSVDELLRALRDGEPRAEKRLFRRLNRELLAFFRRRVDEFEVENLTQQTLEITVKELKEFEPRGPRSFRSFVYSIAMNRLLSHRRRVKRRRREGELPGEWLATPTPPSPDEVTLWRERRALVRDAMLEIKSTMRRTLESRLRGEAPQEFVEGRTIKPGTVRGRVRRATEMIRDRIETGPRVSRERTPTPT
ncbi:RNA polymerase sigma factor [Enhygromyxa salina]|uniref:RNA polymerase sigma factor n=1 Tax=Enhygromyxa salina TaxID=215803 RepID=A0A2S9XRM1_9BACT|nr:sigma-70 family RNA polymerase sigma factor [Enhygromyxa salina]PRP95505.1 RNA polymerase sigma factor [Enhygromyxa salina]